MTARRSTPLIVWPLLMAALLTACGGGESIGVSVSAVNYTERGIRYFSVHRPGDAKRSAVGMSIRPYGAGGVTCCVPLPEQWHEGLEVVLTISPALEGDTTDEIREDYIRRRDNGTLDLERTVAVPRYGDPDRATLWLQALPGGRYAVVVSEVDPPHEDWPGEIRGWPQPSDAYRRKLIDQRLEEIRGTLERTRKNLALAKSGNQETFDRYWKIDMRLVPEDLEGYTGPEDVKYKKYLIDTLERGISHSKRRIRKLQEARP
ncbi:DUF3304 domain-containing protein [Arhodomonas aquaeolei]|uniref:DUF3304 domain-containing protein n=1 Tax=Arhodomonas aquaeolei TaxID=2369 RepID=UPI00216A21D2|nr:DUF3304 domain-containing protein [Arhodomonas aquaeolei]MCS4504546.1 DUF3304 domain-containing protein [Arhodomonas aquaeolei]